MPRTKGSKNKKVVATKVKAASNSNFKSLEIKVVKTEIYQLGISKSDIEITLLERAKKEAHFFASQQFEKEELIYDKKRNIFITLTNPIADKSISKANTTRICWAG